MIVKPSRIGHQIRGINDSMRANQILLGNRQLGIDEDWHVVGAAGEPNFQNGWTHYTNTAGVQSVAFYKDVEGRVHLRGSMQQSVYGGQPSGLNVFQLPLGYRPHYINDPQVVALERPHGAVNPHFMWLQTLEIQPSGWVLIPNGYDYNWVRLDDVEFWVLGT